MSHYLKRDGREHVLERAPAVANTWRNQRWDSFTLVTPNFQVRMPGAEYQGNDPYGFMPLAEVVKYFDNYTERFGLPVHCGVEVFSVEKTREGYLIRTSEGNYQAENVVIATGLYQAPKIPKFSAEIPLSILQMHSMKYRNPSFLPDGAVLVVGTGQSGAQIAEELYQSGKKVYLSIGSAGRVPRRRFFLTLRTPESRTICGISESRIRSDIGFKVRGSLSRPEVRPSRQTPPVPRPGRSIPARGGTQNGILPNDFHALVYCRGHLTTTVVRIQGWMQH